MVNTFAFVYMGCFDSHCQLSGVYPSDVFPHKTNGRGTNVFVQRDDKWANLLLTNVGHNPSCPPLLACVFDFVVLDVLQSASSVLNANNGECFVAATGVLSQLQAHARI